MAEVTTLSVSGYQGNPQKREWTMEVEIDMAAAATAKGSALANADWGESGSLRNGLVLNNWNGFRVYVSNNLPNVGTGPETTGTGNQNSNFGVIVAGHDSAVATAEQINQTEKYRDPDSFADICRGMHLYGRKILRSEALVTAKYNLA